MLLNEFEIKVLICQTPFLTKYFKTQLFLHLVSLLLKQLLPFLYTPEQMWQGDFKQLAEILV